MTPERAYAKGLQIALDVADQLEEIKARGGPITDAVMRTLVLNAARKLGMTDADAGALWEAWPKVMKTIFLTRARIIREEGEILRRNVRHFQNTRFRDDAH